MLLRRVIPFAQPSEKVSPGARPSLVQVGRDRELLRLRAKIIHLPATPSIPSFRTKRQQQFAR